MTEEELLLQASQRDCSKCEWEDNDTYCEQCVYKNLYLSK